MDKAHGQGRFEHVDGDAGGLKDTTFRAVKRCHKFIFLWRKWRKKSDKPIRTNQETKPGTFNCRAEKTSSLPMEKYRGLRRPLASRQGTWTRHAGSLSLGLLMPQCLMFASSCNFLISLQSICFPTNQNLLQITDGAQGAGTLETLKFGL